MPIALVAYWPLRENLKNFVSSGISHAKTSILPTFASIDKTRFGVALYTPNLYLYSTTPRQIINKDAKFTITFWIAAFSTGVGYILFQNNLSAGFWGVNAIADGQSPKIKFTIFEAGNQTEILTDNHLKPFTWNNVSITHDGTGQDYYIYFNGIKQKTSITSVGELPPPIYDYNIHFGSNDDPAGAEIVALLDDVYIYSSELSSNTILDKYKKEYNYKRKIRGGAFKAPPPPNSINSSFDLYIENNVPSDNSSLDLFTIATSGIIAGIPFYTYSDDSGNINSSHLPLSITAPNIDSGNNNIPLSVEGQYYTTYGYTTLLLKNTGISNEVTLNITGDGITDGAVPSNSNMNLFIRRKPSDMMSMYISGPGTPSESGVTFSVEGAFISESGVNLSIPDVVGVENDLVKMIIRGW